MYQIVGPYESDALSGRISIDSPMGRSLLGCRVGEEITVYAPGGARSYRILAIFVS
jgi:transcription elongation factor GreA